MSEDCHTSNNAYDVTEIRAKVVPVADEYERARIEQNNGGICRHCDSPSGHYRSCPLVNRASAEAHSQELSEGDDIILHGLGVCWVNDVEVC